MTFALLYMDVTNLGDIVIYDNARHLLEKVIKDNKIEDSEILPVDIGGHNFKEMQVPSYVDRMDRIADKVMDLSRKKKFYKRFPNLARRMMLWSWHHSKQYYCFRKTEMPKLEKSDIIIFGGGGLIKYHQQTFHFTIDTVTRFANKRGIPVIINSVGVEGYEEGHPGCMLLKKAVNSNCIKYISTRDDIEVLKNNFMINPEKISEVIGPRGKMINKIIDETGVKIDIEDDGRVFISTPDTEAAAKARGIIEGIARDFQVGDVFTGRVVRIMNFGAFVELAPGKDGMIHISKLADHRVEKVEDVVSIGDELEVKVSEIDAQGRINLVRTDVDYSAKQAGDGAPAANRRRPPRRDGRA